MEHLTDMDGKATAIAHPIQGLVKYHGMRDDTLRYPYHDSISVCTAPSHTLTTAAFDSTLATDQYVIDGDVVEGHGADRIAQVIDHVRTIADTDSCVRLESTNNFPTNVGLGSSSSGFAAAAVAVAGAADLSLTPPELSAIARRGSASAARSVTGGFSILYDGMNDADCRSHRLRSILEEDVRIVVGEVPAFKHTERAHKEAEGSHMFEARLAFVHGQLAAMKDALQSGDFDRVFSIAERDSLSLAATTMTGPEAWVYWRPETLAIFQAVQDLRENGIPAYYSTDTGASVYINTTAEHAETVEKAVAECGVTTHVWKVGGPAQIVEDDRSLF